MESITVNKKKVLANATMKSEREANYLTPAKTLLRHQILHLSAKT